MRLNGGMGGYSKERRIGLSVGDPKKEDRRRQQNKGSCRDDSKICKGLCIIYSDGDLLSAFFFDWQTSGSLREMER